jgi:hypothetical protein
MDCFEMRDGSALINENECVDCGVCLKSARCPAGALFMPEENFEYPRAIRMQFSDPTVKHPRQNTGGRGTEEAKTNDVTAKFRRGEYGLMLEFGRPCVGVWLKEIEKVTKRMYELGIEILDDNPIFGLLDDDGSGNLKKEFADEKVLSTILELKISGEDELMSSLERILPILDTMNTVVSVGIVTRFDDGGGLALVDRLENAGIPVRPAAKINVGLGRPLKRD